MVNMLRGNVFFAVLAVVVFIAMEADGKRHEEAPGYRAKASERPVTRGDGMPVVGEFHDAHKPFAVFGYLPEYRLGGFNYEAAFQTGLTHLIYFSLEVDGSTMVPKALDRLPTKEQAKAARIAADKVGGKVLLGFGGNARSHGFGQMVQTPQTRLKFLQALNHLLEEYDFDGVDYNWEYPADANEWRLWGSLMEESKRYLLGSENVVTFTMFQDPNHFNIIRQFNLLKHADYVHCMSYDMQGKHSTYAFAQEGILMGINDLGGGFETAKKFTIGLPFYARHVQTGHPKTYYELVDQLKSKKVDQVGPYYFNSVNTIYRKTKLARESRIGGVMIWELGQDVQPLDSPKALMWGVLAGVTGKDRKQILAERAAAGGAPLPAEGDDASKGADEL